MAIVDVEIVAHLVDEPDLFAGELAAGAGQRAQVRIDIGGTGVVEATRAGHLRQRIPQPRGLPGEFGGVAAQVRRRR